MKKTDDRMYTDTPCDKCGGPTLAIGAGSIWCPNEDCVPGGHFVVRAAFARPPARDGSGDWVRSAPPQRVQRQPAPRFAPPTGGVRAKPKPAADEWAPSTHDFVETK